MDVEKLLNDLKSSINISSIEIPSNLIEAIVADERIPMTCVEVEKASDTEVDGHTALELITAIDDGLATLAQARDALISCLEMTCSAER